MTISFFEPGDVPKPPHEVKIELLEAQPYPDRWRVKVTVHVTPFQQRPNLEVELLRKPDNANEDDAGNLRLIGNFSIIETMHPRMEFTLHIRFVDDPMGDYVIRAALYYREAMAEGQETPPPPDIKDRREILLSILPQAEESEPNDE